MFFENREILIKDESPDSRWRLIVYAIGETEEDAHYFAEFEKSTEARAIGVPFGSADKPGEVTVDWDLPKNVCAISVSGEPFLLYKWGPGFIRPREFYRHGEDEAFSEAEVKEICGG